MYLKPDEVDVLAGGVPAGSRSRFVLPLLRAGRRAPLEMRRRLRRSTRSSPRRWQTIQKMATHDTLTALPNRALFNEKLLHAHRAGRAPRPLARALLPRPRPLQEHQRHARPRRRRPRAPGMAERRLTAAVRASDIVARLGGDEFVLLVEDFSDNADLSDVAQQDPRRLRAHHAHGRPGARRSRRASASARSPPTATTRRRCSPTPTSPCTAPRNRAATATTSTPRS